MEKASLENFDGPMEDPPPYAPPSADLPPQPQGGTAGYPPYQGAPFPQEAYPQAAASFYPQVAPGAPNPHFQGQVPYSSPPQQTTGAYQPPPNAAESRLQVDNHICLTVIAMMCCLLLGAVALSYSLKVNAFNRQGDEEKAKRSSTLARGWGAAAIATGGLTYLIGGPLLYVIFLVTLINS